MLYIKGLAARVTVYTMPDGTLNALASTQSLTQSRWKRAATARISCSGSPRLVKNRKDFKHDNTSRATH